MKLGHTVFGGVALVLPLVVGIGSTTTHAEAQTAPVGPPGSYQQSCKVTAYGGGMLYAICKKSDGLNSTSSELKTTTCGTADIANIDGRLRCSTGPLPAGPYRFLCPDVWVYGTSLRGSCRVSPVGPVGYSELEYGKCKGPIAVVGHGLLSCDQGNVIPQGSYLQSCTVLRFTDDEVWTDCKKSDGAYNLNSLHHPATCVGDIVNDEGFPRCNRGGLPPPGSYTASCSHVFRVDDVLLARCRTASGATPAAQLASIAACKGADISNENGVLKCTPPAAATAPPPPPPTPTLTKPVPKPLKLQLP